MSYVELVFLPLLFFQTEFAAPLPRMLFCGNSFKSNNVIF